MSEQVIEQLYEGLTTLLRRRGELSADVHPGLSLVSYSVLARLDALPGTRAADLAALFGLDKSTVSRQLDQLEQAGLIGRGEERPGRRGRPLVLTPAGHHAVHAASDRLRQRLRTRLATWDDADIAAFSGLIERFNQLPDC